MDGKSVSELVKLSYDQLNYFVRQIDSLASKSTNVKGKPREFDYRDLVLLRLAATLRNDGFGMAAINQAVGEVDRHWSDADPEGAGVLLYGGDGKFRWMPNEDGVLFYLLDDAFGVRKNIPKFLYVISAKFDLDNGGNAGQEEL